MPDESATYPPTLVDSRAAGCVGSATAGFMVRPRLRPPRIGASSGPAGPRESVPHPVLADALRRREGQPPPSMFSLVGVRPAQPCAFSPGEATLQKRK